MEVLTEHAWLQGTGAVRHQFAKVGGLNIQEMALNGSIRKKSQVKDMDPTPRFVRQISSK